MDKHRLCVLLSRAVQAKNQELITKSLLEHFCYVLPTGDNRLQIDKLISKYVQEAVDVTPEVTDQFITELGLNIQNMPTVIKSVQPMDYEEFSTKYIEARKLAGGQINTEIVTEAYAVYCSDPAGHFLHKEK